MLLNGNVRCQWSVVRCLNGVAQRHSVVKGDWLWVIGYRQDTSHNPLPINRLSDELPLGAS